MPRILDLFCCQGGMAMGYHNAGFEVVGWDLDGTAGDRYPFEFHQGNAIEVLRDLDYVRTFDAVHTSPPCQGYSTITPDQSKWPLLIRPVRELLSAAGVPYVIENVEGARRDMVNPLRLCGSSFGLGVRRHRLFESNVMLYGRPCEHKGHNAIGVYGDHPDSREFLRPDGRRRGRKATSLHEASEALGGVEWMNWRGMAECVPPAFSEFIGRQILEVIA